MTTDYARIIKEIGNPDCKHTLDDGSSAYEWRVYGIEYIKTCSICCVPDYSSRTINCPELEEKISTDALIDRLTGNLITIGAMANARACNPATDRIFADKIIADIERENTDLRLALLSRGVDIAKYIKTGEEVIRE